MFVLSPEKVAQAAVDAVEAGRDGQAIMPWFLFKPLLVVKSLMMAFGGYGVIDDGSDPMGKLDYSQANRLFSLMGKDETEAVAELPRARL
jgi:hypothetical protein